MLNRIASLACLALVPAVSSAQSVSLVDAYTTDEQGQRVQPVLGEPIFVTAVYRVSGISSPYQLRFSTGYTGTSAAGRLADGEHRFTWGPVPTLMDRPFNVEVSIDPTGTSGDADGSDNHSSWLVQPARPATGLEYFNPQSLDASLAFYARFASSNMPKRVVIWTPRGTTGSFQSILSVTDPSGSKMLMSAPQFQPIAVSDNSKVDAFGMAGTQSAHSIASSARINSSVLRTVTFAQLKKQSKSYTAWMRPEAYIESSHREIAAVVKATLPKNFQSTMSPAEVAERLYLEVLRRSTYTATSTGKPSALHTLRTGEGDCGYLSALFVAMCRNAGIPARTVNGFTMGVDKWHVWAEFAIPGHGWVPVDPAYAEGYNADGTLPLYFGVIPDLNSRFATGYGYDRSAMRLRLPMLQSPAIFWFGSNAKLETFAVSSSLSVASTP